MTMTALLFGFAMIDNIVLLLINVYNIITLSDLEADLLNAQHSCQKLNQTFLPEFILHTLLSVFFIVSQNWLLCLLTVPLDVWLAYKYFKRQPGQLGLYDPLEINNRGKAKAYIRDFLIRLPYYLICFFIYLFLLIQALI